MSVMKHRDDFSRLYSCYAWVLAMRVPWLIWRLFTLMKALKSGLILSVLTLSSLAFAHQDPAVDTKPAATKFTIKRVFVEGEKTDYKFTNVFDGNLDLSSFGAPNMTMTVTTSLKAAMTIKKVAEDKKSADLEVKITDNVMSMEPAMPGAPEFPKEFSLTGKISDRNKVTDTKTEGVSDMMKTMAGATLELLVSIFEFPDKEIGIGESWSYEKTGKSMAGDGDTKIKIKLVGEEKLFKMDVLKLELSGTSKVTTESQDGMGMGPMKSTSDATINSVVYIEKATGRLVKMEAKSVPLKITTEMSGMNIPMDGIYSTEMVIAEFAK